MNIHVIFVILSMTAACRSLVIDKNNSLPEILIITTTKDPLVTVNLTEKTTLRAEKSSTTPENLPHASSSIKNNFKNLTDAPKIDNSASKAEKPRNIVLLMVEDTDSSSWWEKTLKKHSFPLKKHLKSCLHEKTNNDSESSQIETCHCNRLVQDKIGDLLTWARIHHEMNTVMISDRNFSLPTTRDLNPPSKIDSDVEILGFKLPFVESPRSKDQSLSSGKKLDLIKPNPNDSVWDIVDMISKIRTSILRRFFKSLHDAIKFLPKPEDKSHPKFSPNFGKPAVKVADLISSSLMDLQSFPNDNGFIMMVIVPPNDVDSALRTIDHQMPKKESLVVVSGSCSRSNDSTPLFAAGSRSMELERVQTVAGLFKAIKSMLGQCPEGCKHGQSHFSLPFDGLVPKRRFARSDDDETLPASPYDEKHMADEFTETTSPITSTSETTDVPNFDDEPVNEPRDGHAEHNGLPEPIGHAEHEDEPEGMPSKSSLGSSCHDPISTLIIFSVAMPILMAFQSYN